MKTTKTKSLARGVVMVEMAIILPLLLLLTVAVIEYGWLFLKSQENTNVVRTATRYAARPNVTNSQVLSEITDLMGQAGLGGSGYTVTVTPANIAAMSTGEILAIRIDVPYRGQLELVRFPLIPVPNNITASMSIAKEGP